MQNTLHFFISIEIYSLKFLNLHQCLCVALKWNIFCSLFFAVNVKCTYCNITKNNIIYVCEVNCVCSQRHFGKRFQNFSKTIVKICFVYCNNGGLSFEYRPKKSHAILTVCFHFFFFGSFCRSHIKHGFYFGNKHIIFVAQSQLGVFFFVCR